MHRAFPRKVYGSRAKIETVISVIKRKLSAKAPGRSLSLQVRQALLLGLAFNLYRLRHCPAFLKDVNRATLTSFRMNTSISEIRKNPLKSHISLILQPLRGLKN